MSAMTRVGRSHPCPICKKGDWCLTGTDIALCMRVESNRPKWLSDGSLGYLHRIDGAPLPSMAELARKSEPRKVQCDWGSRLKQWEQSHGLTSLNYLSKSLGVTRKSLELLGTVKSPQHSVWGFPMFDAKRNPIGIRLRHENGKKWSEPGSFNGLFIPDCPAEKTMAICEGPTDTAAALTIGVYAIGRFNNCGGVDMIIEYIMVNKIKRVIIVADCDQDQIINDRVTNPGISGAIRLSGLLPVTSCTLTLPCKDMRAFVQRGGDSKTFNALTSQLVWHKTKT
jgi:hypothetical protein